MSLSDDPIWMTGAAFESLQTELAELSASGRAVTSDEQARIIQLRELIRRAEVGTKPDDGLVEAGMKVTVRFLADDAVETFLLGDRGLLGGDAEHDIYSPRSPLGQAITGRRVGERVHYTSPTGASIEVEILSAVPFV